MKSLMRCRKGIVMPSVVAIVAIITILGLTAAFIADSETLLTLRYSNSEKALYFAEAGINKYLWHLNKDSKYYDKTTFTGDEAEPGVETTFYQGVYTLEVVKPTAAEPVVTIRSTGWPASDPANKRTVEVQVKKRQFAQNIYVSNRENAPATGNEVWWITGDVMNGPLHTNGQLHINGDPVFNDQVTYSGADPDLASGSDPVFARPGDPEKVAQLAFPNSNNQLANFAKLDNTYYNGRTSIYLKGNVYDVRRYNINTSQWVYQQNLALPGNGVIYVDGTTTDKFSRTTGNVFVSGQLDGRLTIAAANDIYITGNDPTNTTYNTATSTNGLTYANTDFSGSSISDDMLGLVANRYVRILHKNWPTDSGSFYSSNSNVAPTNITIHAAIFALQWAFEFEDYGDGSARGTITTVGSITQNYRGAVGTFNSSTGNRISGYLKNYTHDPRMSYDTPPHFLEPTNAGWEIVSWKQAANP